MGVGSDKRKRVGFVVMGNNEMGEIVGEELLVTLGKPNSSHGASAHIGPNIAGGETANINVSNTFD